MIAVVGSVNIDFVFEVERHPTPGETVTASALHTIYGGKGANQAVAAARLGGVVTLVAAVGDDAQSTEMRDDLASEGVDVTRVQIAGGTSSGLAAITVDAHGENSIVVYPGANHVLTLSDGDRSAIAMASVVLVQLEVEMAVAIEAVQVATGTVILNAAPATPLPKALLGHVDTLIVNEHERTVALQGAETGALTVITTFGAEGVSVEARGTSDHVPSIEVEVVDTTGAGDTFCGAFAEAVARGEAVLNAAKWAAVAASLATTQIGARTAMPIRRDVERALREIT